MAETGNHETVNRFGSSLSLAGLFSGGNRKPTLILLLTPILLTTFKYYGSKQWYEEFLSDIIVLGGTPEWTAALYVFLSSFILLGLVPFIVIRFVFKEQLSLYGWQLGDARFGLTALAILAPLFVASAYPSASMPDFMAEYPLYRGAGTGWNTFALHALSYGLFYVGWETYFRGFMQFGLRSTVGDWNSILIQVLASCLVHIGKPAAETFSSILGGLLWGILAFRTRSILYGLAIHWLLGVALDFFIVM
ncbi:MAG: CPBP family intramembrane metalloprotease [Ignavibacteriales bacterium]|nr:CPBP family intramembrane metalloprotease [Ignavibacteriales bacterium]